jgi:hypothetical protein
VTRDHLYQGELFKSADIFERKGSAAILVETSPAPESAIRLELDSVTPNAANTAGRKLSKAISLNFMPAEEICQVSRAFSFIFDTTDGRDLHCSAKCSCVYSDAHPT